MYQETPPCPLGIWISRLGWEPTTTLVHQVARLRSSAASPSCHPARLSSRRRKKSCEGEGESAHASMHNGAEPTGGRPPRRVGVVRWSRAEPHPGGLGWEVVKRGKKSAREGCAM